jgi:hypothetical protein
MVSKKTRPGSPAMSTGAGEFGLELAIEEAAISRLGNSEGLHKNGGYVKTVILKF